MSKGSKRRPFNQKKWDEADYWQNRDERKMKAELKKKDIVYEEKDILSNIQR